MFYDVEPFGDERDDWRHAIGAAGIMTMLKSGEAVHPKKLLAVKPYVDPEKAAEQRRKLRLAKMSAAAAISRAKEKCRQPSPTPASD
jgi:hypothetical protein